jgi:hypothetical protein
MKKISSLLAAFSAFIVISLGAAAPAAAAFDPLHRACEGIQNSAVCSDAAKQDKNDNPIINTVAKTTKIISLIVGFASVIMIVVSGLNMITSSGNSESVASARKKLTGAIIGLVLASLAWVLSSFVINQLL